MKLFCLKIQSFSIVYFFSTIILVNFVFGTAQPLEKNSPELRLQTIKQIKYSNPQLAKNHALKLLEEAQHNNTPKWEFHAYHQLGRIANIMGDYANAILHSEKAILIGKLLNKQEFEIEGYLSKGNALVYLGKDKKALDHYLKALTIAKNLKDIDYEIRSSASVAKVKRRIGQTEEALKIYMKNLHLALQNQSHKKITLINAYMGVGGTYLRLNKPDSTLFYSNIGLSESLKINDLEGAGYFYNDIGMAYFKKKAYEKAIYFLKKAEKSIRDLNNKTRLTETYFFIGNSYYQLNKYDEAIHYLDEIEHIVKEQNTAFLSEFNPPELLSSYKLLASAYKKKNNQSQSLLYTEKYISLDKHNDDHRNAVIQTLFENKENDVQKLSDLNAKQQLRFYVLIAALIAVLITSILLFIKFMQVRKKNKSVSNIFEKKQRKTPKEFQIQDKKVDDILRRLEKLETSNFFLDPNCNLQSMAKKVKTNVNYLSQVISIHRNKSFYEYINEVRIQYAIKRLHEDPKFRKYSIKHIGQELGYKSANSFTKYFKTYTKTYPSSYIKRLNEKGKKVLSN